MTADGAEPMIRDHVAADLPEITDLWVATWQAAYPAIDFEQRRVWFVDRVVAHVDAGGRVLVAQDATGAIVGLALIDPATGEMDQIAVAPGAQGSNVATALLRAVEDASPAGVDLTVNQDNARAIAFYRRHGFVVTGEAVNERSGAPVYRMSWRPG